MSSAIQVFPLADLKERLENSPHVNVCVVYNGHLSEATREAMTVCYLKRDKESGTFPATQFRNLNKLRGEFTAVLKPSNEMIFLSSEENNPMNGMGFPNFMPFEAYPAHPIRNKQLNEVINRVIELERENEALKKELAEAREDLKQFESNGDKLAYVGIKMIEEFLPRLVPQTKEFFQTNKNNNVMQGTQKNLYTYDVSGTSDQHVENALELLLDAFGDENILKFARKVQQDPNLVNTLIKFI